MRIIAILCKAFRPPRITISETDDLLTEKMLLRAAVPNALQQRPEENGWLRKRVIWQEVQSDTIADFPKLTAETSIILYPRAATFRQPPKMR